MTALPQRLPAPSLVPALYTGLVRVGEAASTAEGQLAYDKGTTPPSLARILEAQATRPVRQLKDNTLDVLLIGELQHAARRLGHKFSATDPLEVRMMSDDIKHLLRLKWAYLTEGEIREVFLLGSLRQLLRLDKHGQPDASEVVFLSSATVGEWLTRYKYQVKPEAMKHARRVAPESSELPHHHPVCARWRIQMLAWLQERGPKLATDSPDEADPANLLYLWLGEIGALREVLASRPAAYWHRLRQQEAYRQGRRGQLDKDRDKRRASNTYLGLIRSALPSHGDLPARVRAACRWRIFCQWLIAHHARGTDLHALLWPLAQAAYTAPPVTPAP